MESTNREQDPAINDTSSTDAGASDLISDTESVGSRTDGPTESAAPQKEEDWSEDEIKRAEEFKAQGNTFFQQNKHPQAIDMYTEAIFCKVPPAKKAIYYCNRAFAHYRMESYAICVFDGCEAIKLDPTNVKGYFRRGQGYAMQRQLKNAVADFKTICKMQPANKEAREKFECTQKEYRLQQLSLAIVSDETRVEAKVEDMIVEASYAGPKLETADDVTAEWVVSMMEWQKSQKRVHKKFATMIIQRATEIFEKDETLVHISIDELEEITVCGDVHGQYYDLLNLFSINGNPSEENPYLFNGDFIDRGSFSVEVVLTMLAWKVCYPQHFFMSRGNHEAKQLNRMYGFEGEVKAKYDIKTYDLFSQLFCFLPLCHVINKKVMVTHGGLFSKDGIKLSDIEKTNRRREPPDEGIMCELMWSDPQDDNGRAMSKRGVGVQFGPDIAAKFLDDNNLKMLVRSHEVKPEGFEYQKGNRVVTVFSAPNYCDQMGNKGAFIRFQGSDMEPKIASFEKVDHPKVPPMAYANQWGNFF